jgi:DNA methylase
MEVVNRRRGRPPGSTTKHPDTLAEVWIRVQHFRIAARIQTGRTPSLRQACEAIVAGGGIVFPVGGNIEALATANGDTRKMRRPRFEISPDESGVVPSANGPTAGRDVYTELKNIVVWVKSTAGMGSLYRSQHELICVFKSGAGPHINNIQLGRNGRNRTNIWKYDSAGTQFRKGNNVLELHPTVKPLQLVMDALLDCSNRGDSVLDCFLGSGTTLLAAEHTGRICRGIELDPLYVDTAIRRWQNLTGQDAVRVKDGKLFREIEAETEQQ